MAQTVKERVRRHRQRQLDRIAELEAQVASQCPHPEVAVLEAQTVVLTAQLTRDGQRPTRSHIVKELGEALAQARRRTQTWNQRCKPQRAVGDGGTGCQRSPQRRGGNRRRQSGRGRPQTRRPAARRPGHPRLLRHRAVGAIRPVGEAIGATWRPMGPL